MLCHVSVDMEALVNVILKINDELMRAMIAFVWKASVTRSRNHTVSGVKICRAPMKVIGLNIFYFQ